MTEEETEAVADRFYAADAWMARQGQLAGWLWSQDMASAANKITVAALESINTWPEITRKDLIDTFFYSKYIQERNVGWKSESVQPVAA